MAIAFQVVSVLAAELAQPPASPLERAAAGNFLRYYQLLDQGHAHRFYTDIGPTPILNAELRFGDGRPNRTIRIPDRSARPRMVYQRQLALANFALETGAVESFARHLCRENPGCSGVTIRLQQHENPPPGRLIEAARVPGARRVDPDAEEFYSTPVLLGDFPCPPQ